MNIYDLDLVIKQLHLVTKQINEVLFFKSCNSLS